MSKQEDLTGKQFNRWKVLKYLGKSKWLCECQCGTIKEVSTYSLKAGLSKSCGCLRKELNSSNKLIDLTGQHFDEWEVLGYSGNSYWKCRCSCGAIKDVKGESLRFKLSTSCGHNTTSFKNIKGQTFNGWEAIKYLGDQQWQCKCVKCGQLKEFQSTILRKELAGKCRCSRRSPKIIDLSGQVFGNLIVIKYVGNNKWLCRCSCGNTSIHYSHNLRRSSTISCGCKEVKPLTKDYIINEINTFKNSNNRLPYRYELCELIDRSYSSTEIYIQKYELHNLILRDNRSKAEEELLKLFPTPYNNYRGLLNTLEVDLYYPEQRLAIEYNGVYWHSSIFKNKQYHQNKVLELLKLDISLIHIYEYEWENDDKKRKIIALLNRNIHTYNKKIYGRDTKITEINNELCVDFCNKYHLQNGINSKVNIGMYYNSELIGIMAFGKPRFNREYQWEITRLCFKDNINVVGGAEKLYNYFLRKYNPSSIISYCNLDKFNGRVYERLGFIKDGITEPNYVWVNSKLEVYSRYQTQKQKLIYNGIGESSETEDEIMSDCGFYKIYDSGSIRYIWHRKISNTDININH